MALHQHPFPFVISYHEDALSEFLPFKTLYPIIHRFLFVRIVGQLSGDNGCTSEPPMDAYSEACLSVESDGLWSLNPQAL